ncbi:MULTISPECIES: IS982 family transposase [unclassified Acinetobacter]|uniref:IS982 family transposase n=1 Tax=unclassified Acinetobacter TaxID=196816 RepID=UPI0029347A01|nr:MULTISPECIES: IS982 family transposase [unclassified Acinetobacter]WOE33340.1 IS982 family transposase [Acinetobacter sp. SAAs470]WOE37048.1 IS982 family transposase [Acinetobacter sp. SAAs474]
MFNSTELFCVIDDFFLKFEATYWKFLKQSNHCLRIRTGQLSISEIIFIAIWYKCSHFNNFKAFFSWLKQDKCHLFKSLPCYQRMIHLINMHQLALHALHVALMKDQYKQYLWIDSTTLLVCKNQRIHLHKSLVRIASRGKSSMGWFYGCKLHIVMNQFGKIVSSALSNGHIADIKMVEKLVAGLQAKLYADRGYISKELKSRLRDQGIDLITYHRKNMKSVQLQQSDEYHLKQRNKIETLFSLLKGQYNLVTSKARSILGFLSGIYASLCAYQLIHRNKPTIQIIESLA